MAKKYVALPVSAWIEMIFLSYFPPLNLVALPVSAWIEIPILPTYQKEVTGRTPRECVD